MFLSMLKFRVEGKLPFRSDRSRRPVSGKKQERIIVDKQLFAELFRKRFCRETMQGLSGHSCRKAVAGKYAVSYFKEIRIGRMSRNRKAFNGKPRNSKRTVSPQHFSLFAHKCLIRCVYSGIIDF